jgi:DNA-binding NarL/FixJ family response regulator
LHILIADDHKIVRDTLRSLLKTQQPDWKVSEAADGREAIKVFREAAPDVAVLDIVMQPLGGVAAAHEIKRIAPTAKIILISSHFTPAQASMFSRVLGAGAFVPKSDTGKLLIPTIRKLLTEAN